MLRQVGNLPPQPSDSITGCVYKKVHALLVTTTLGTQLLVLPLSANSSERGPLGLSGARLPLQVRLALERRQIEKLRARLRLRGIDLDNFFEEMPKEKS